LTIDIRPASSCGHASHGSGIAGTAEAFYAGGAGVVTAVLTSVPGTLYATYGGTAFLSMAAVCAVALPFAWFDLGKGPSGPQFR
jgi:PPP family 3-phenylpropionic acid transporter